jgi:hypothetical protein
LLYFVQLVFMVHRYRDKKLSVSFVRFSRRSFVMFCRAQHADN